MRVVVADDALLTREGIVHLLAGAGVDVVAEVEDADALLREVARLAPRRRRRRHPDATDPHRRRSRRRPAHPRRLPRRRRARALPVSRAELRHAAARGASREGRLPPQGAGLRRRRAGRRASGASTRAKPWSTRRSCPASSAGTATTIHSPRSRPREHEVLALVAEGRSNKAIGTQLHLADRTVEAHITQIFLKLGVDSSPDSHRRVLAVLTFLRR